MGALLLAASALALPGLLWAECSPEPQTLAATPAPAEAPASKDLLQEIFADSPENTKIDLGGYWGYCTYFCEPCYQPEFGANNCPPHPVTGGAQKCHRLCP